MDGMMVGMVLSVVVQILALVGALEVIRLVDERLQPAEARRDVDDEIPTSRR